MKLIADLSRYAPLIFALFLCSTYTEAALIFSDAFERPNADIVGQTWLETENESDDVAISSNRLRLRSYLDNDTHTSALFNIDLSSWDDVYAEFTWQVLSSTEASDTLLFGFSNDQPASFSATLGERGVFSTVVELAQAEDIGLSTIGFWTEVNSRSEQVYIHSFALYGNEKQSQAKAVNEPSSLALFGLSALALTRLRKNRRSNPRLKPTAHSKRQAFKRLMFAELT